MLAQVGVVNDYPSIDIRVKKGGVFVVRKCYLGLYYICYISQLENVSMAEADSMGIASKINTSGECSSFIYCLSV